jgi:hypothetical protein
MRHQVTITMYSMAISYPQCFNPGKSAVKTSVIHRVKLSINYADHKCADKTDKPCVLQIRI